MYWFFAISRVAANSCPLSPATKPFDRPAVSLAQKCLAWTKQVCCDDLRIEQISRAVNEFRKNSKCMGCADNLEAVLCGAACSPVLISGNFLEISPVFCAAAQLSCDGVPQCSASSHFSEALTALTGRELSFKSVDTPSDELLPLSAECSPAKLPAAVAVAPASPSWGLQLVLLVGVCVGLWLSSRLRAKARRREYDWSSLDISAGDGRL